MIHIELAGLPGSGKSTFATELKSLLNTRGLATPSFDGISNLKYTAKSAPRFVRGDSARELLYRFLDFRRKHPEFWALCETKFSPDEVSNAEYLFSLCCGNFERLLARPKHRSVFITDEGLIHRGVELYCEDPNPEEFGTYLEHAPLTQAIVMLEISPETALHRAIARRPERKPSQVISKLGGLEKFERRAALLTTARRHLQRHEIEVFRVDATRPFAEQAKLVAETILASAPE